VRYPGLADHPGKAVHDGQALGPGAVLSFELKTADHTRRLLENAALPLVSVSLGGVETILSHPATMSHASMPPAERAERGIRDTLVRLSVGLENPEDIWSDLVRALEQKHPQP
jgi:cystathionine beta-lyase/cystathionine gamma-synthase